MRRILILVLLFIFSNIKIINSQNPLIESEYNCTINLLNIISQVSIEYSIDSSFNGYNFCGTSLHPMDITIVCNTESRTVTYIRAIHKNKTNLLSPDHFQCYSTLNTINIDTFKVTNQFLLGKFPETLKTVSLLNGASTLFNIGTGVNKTIPFFNLTVKVFLSGALNIYFSSLINLNKFDLTTQTLAPKYKIKYINDLNDSIITENLYFVIFKTYTHYIPSMNNIKASLLDFTLLPGTDKNSFSNFLTFANIEGFNLKPSDNSQIYPFPISLSNIPININKNTGFSIGYQIEKPIDYIDLSNYPNDSVVQIDITNSGSLFNIDGNFPFSKLPPNLYSIEFTNGNISVINFNDFFNEKSSTIDFSNNGLTGKIPTSTFIKSMDVLLDLYLNNNELTGEMDDSWCSIGFDVSNNYIGGKAPSCIVCHYLNPTTSTIVDGNRFTNLDASNLEDCTTIEINLAYDNETKSLMLYGRDLGFGTSSFRLDNPNKWASFIKIPNILFQISKRIGVTGPIAKGFNITFPYLPQGPRTFEITAYNEFIPQINSVIRYSDYFIINGKYFAYNNSIINVLISNQPCLVLSSNFNQIQCYLYNSNKIINNSVIINNNNNNNTSGIINKEINCFVQVMNVSNSFNFTVNEICNGNNCPMPTCNIKNGEYNEESGICHCFSNEWRGYQCEQLSMKCSSDCSNNDSGGICNNINGKCECSSNRIFDDCSGKLCNEGAGCNNEGICNNLIGQCNCTNQWTGSNCNIPNIAVYSQQIKQGDLGYILVLNGWFGSDFFRNDLSITLNHIECDIVSDSDYMVECYPPDIYCDQYSDDMELSVSQKNVHWSGFYNPIPLDGLSVCINNNSSGTSSTTNTSGTSSTTNTSGTSSTNSSGTSSASSSGTGGTNSSGTGSTNSSGTGSTNSSSTSSASSSGTSSTNSSGTSSTNSSGTSSSSNQGSNHISGENDGGQNSTIVILISILIPSVILLIILVLVIKNKPCSAKHRNSFKEHFTELEERDTKLK
ncbi:hypothetical protein ACTFIV_004812 [Dictyostelium citrinum]